VGSNPTRSTFITQGNYGIIFELILGYCGTKTPSSNALDKGYSKKFDERMFEIPRLYISQLALSYMLYSL